LPSGVRRQLFFSDFAAIIYKNSKKDGLKPSFLRKIQLFSTALVECRVTGVEITGLKLILHMTQRFANTINMKWILKEPPTAFLNDILTRTQHRCAFIKVPLLLPYSLDYGVMRLFFTDFSNVYSLASRSHHLLTRFWYNFIVHTEVMHI